MPAQKAYAAVATTIAEYQDITVCCSHEQFLNARAMLDHGVRLIEMSYNDALVRDTGPCFVKNDEGDIRINDALGRIVIGNIIALSNEISVAEVVSVQE